MKEKRKQHNLHEIYNGYVRKKIKENPEWYSVFCKKDCDSNTLYRKTEVTGMPVEVMSYRRFKAILLAYLDEAEHRIVGDEHTKPCKLRMERLGTIIIERVERDHSKKKLNCGATRKLNQINPATGKLTPVYWDDDDWCVIAWEKPSATPLMSSYIFKPVDGRSQPGDETHSFEDLMRHQLKALPNLKFQYRFRPLLRKQARDTRNLVKAKLKEEHDTRLKEQLDNQENQEEP